MENGPESGARMVQVDDVKVFRFQRRSKQNAHGTLSIHENQQFEELNQTSQCAGQFNSGFDVKEHFPRLTATTSLETGDPSAGRPISQVLRRGYLRRDNRTTRGSTVAIYFDLFIYF